MYHVRIKETQPDSAFVWWIWRETFRGGVGLQSSSNTKNAAPEKVFSWMRVIGNDLRRAVCSRRFCVTVLLMALVEILSSGTMLTVRECCVVEIIDNLFSGSGSSDLLIMLFPLLPYALTYAREEEERAVAFWVTRTETSCYMTGKYLAACVSSLLCVSASFVVLMVVLMCMGHPLNRDMAFVNRGYSQLLADGKPIWYLVTYLLDRGLGAAMAAGSAVWISSIYPNQFLAFVGPVCLQFVALRVISFPDMPLFFNVMNWTGGTYDFDTAGMTLLCKAGVALLVCSVFGVCSLLHVKRRWHHA